MSDSSLALLVRLADSNNRVVIPAKAGIQVFRSTNWIPAYAGMTEYSRGVLTVALVMGSGAALKNLV